MGDRSERQAPTVTSALEAVVADIDRRGVDHVLQGGDLALAGCRTAEVIDAVRELGWGGSVGVVRVEYDVEREVSLLPSSRYPDAQRLAETRRRGRFIAVGTV